MRGFLSLLLLALLGAVQALSSTGSRLLVVLEDLADKDKYSKFWGDLESRGFSISYESPRSQSLSLFKHGALAYDHLAILPSKGKGLGPHLTPNLIVDFTNKGGNVLLALSAETGTPSAISSLLLELDVTLPPERNALVVDHFSFDTKSAAEKHDVLLLPAQAVKTGVKDYFHVDGTIAVPRAVGQVLGNASPLLTPILRAPSTAYSYNPKDEADTVEDLFAVGSQLSLVSAFQARNSARFTILGSSEMLEDAWFDAKVQAPKGQEESTANKAFAEKLSAWTFQELGVLKVGRIQHYLNEGKVKETTNLSVSQFPELNPSIYRIKNDVYYSIELSEYEMDHTVPYTPNGADAVQLEFSMLSPFHRLTLQPTGHTANSTIFTTTFKLPDQHGIFNFLVNYKRPFLTNVYEKRTVTVRHFAHNEWPRSFVISGAYPWISGIGVTVAGWLVFVGLWLWSKPVEDRTKKTQ